MDDVFKINRKLSTNFFSLNAQAVLAEVLKQAYVTRSDNIHVPHLLMRVLGFSDLEIFARGQSLKADLKQLLMQFQQLFYQENSPEFPNLFLHCEFLPDQVTGLVRDATTRLLDARLRPGRKVIMRQNWDQLLFLHWTCDPAEVQKRLPAGLTVDTFGGEAHIGVVGFRMNKVRPAGFSALPWLSYFNELNVRVYVRDASGEPGVYFLSLDCDRWPAVKIARTCFCLPYEHAQMSQKQVGEGWEMNCLRAGQAHSARYAWNALTPPVAAEPGSLLFHLAERYNFFTVKSGRLMRGQVHHSPYQIRLAHLTTYSELPIEWDGFPITGHAPALVHCCTGVSVEAFALQPAYA